MSLSLILAAATCTTASEAVLCLCLDMNVTDAVLLLACLRLCGFCAAESYAALCDAKHCGLIAA